MICCLRRSRLVLVILALIAGFIGLGFYFQWPFVTQNWPIFIFLLCPLGHFLGEHGRADHEGNKEEVKRDKSCH